MGCSEPKFDDPVPDADRGASEASDGSLPAQRMRGDAALSDAAARGSRDAGPSEAGEGMLDGTTSAAPTTRDAEVSVSDASASASDASVGQPSWAASLPGRYAVRAITFSKDNTTLSQGRMVFTAEIGEVAGEYQITLQRCELLAQNSFGSFRLIKPNSLAPLRHRFVFAGDTFSTEPLVWEEGYEKDAPAECADRAGQLIPKRAFQTWIPATEHDRNLCRCPGPLIPGLDDCRVIDPDEDRLPGFSYDVKTVGGLGDTKAYGVNASYSRFIEGRRSAEGVLKAQVEAKETAVHFDCVPSGCLNLTGTAPSCPPKSSSAEFVPLAGLAAPSEGWSCDAVLARMGQLFPTSEPPPSCD